MNISVKEMIIEELEKARATLILSEISLSALNKMKIDGSQAGMIEARRKEVKSLINFNTLYIEELAKYVEGQKWDVTKK